MAPGPSGVQFGSSLGGQPGSILILPGFIFVPFSDLFSPFFGLTRIWHHEARVGQNQVEMDPNSLPDLFKTLHDAPKPPTHQNVRDQRVQENLNKSKTI